ncbi:putative peptidase [Cercophora samala]|uniref:Peptidase n=1 Tax=Cercophora samala TaxID=330535 RepID=A0AA39Z0S0_9PEZI|nr:putative peptidase [Cercophora samala]
MQTASFNLSSSSLSYILNLTMTLTTQNLLAAQPVEDDDSDDEYNDGPAHSPFHSFAIIQKDPTREAFDEIIADAESNKLRLGDKAYREAFKQKYQQHFEGRVPPENQTLLHLVANRVGHRGLTLLLIKNSPHLLNMADDNGKTPLYIAITRKNENVLRAIVDKFNGDLDQLLARACDHGRNSIHAAILHNLPEQHTLALIQRASEATLCAGDHDGLTALHLAIQYDRCSASQQRVVEALLQRADACLDQFTINPPELSVYEYHYHTRTDATQKSGLDTGRAGEPSGTPQPANANHGKSPTGRVGHLPDSLPHLHNVESARGRTTNHGPAKKGGDVDAQRGREMIREQSNAPSTRNMDPPPQDRTTGVKRDVNKEWADRIIQGIKLHYLRSTFRTPDRPQPRDQSQALRFLHGSNIEDWNLYFDYSKGVSPVHRSSFEQSFAHMRFDSVLRYVAFNKIELHSSGNTTSKLHAKRLAQQSKPGRGRTDLIFFFNWLRDKSVKHILKVVVDDWPESPHSDKAIEDSLKNFEIESLEWRKSDICPETLFVACREARHLHLWWSGNRAILRAWSDPDGLVRLEKLKTIQLLWNSAEVLEPADRIQSYVEDFKRRLRKAVRNYELEKQGITSARPQNDKGVPVPGIRRTVTGDRLAMDGPVRTITVEAIEENMSREDNGSSSGTRAKPMRAANQRNLSAHKWLNCMDAFADEIQNVPVPPTQHKLLKKDITVALIDDGVNIDTPTIAGKVIGGATFDRGEPDENGPSPYFISASGHGTVMADMICRVCPTAKLYVFKLETHLSQDPLADGQTHNQIVARSATQSIDAAVARGVDIISISWTVKKPKERERDADLKDLGDAIKRALDAGILVFCAAGDAGNFSDEEYPYEFDRSRIIRIGAATDDGRPWERSGDTHSLNFIFPGCSVVSRHGTSNSAIPSHFQENTGSSVATALAAGLAALVLHVVRLAAMFGEREREMVKGGGGTAVNGVGSGAAGAVVEAGRLATLKDYRNMKLVFQKIGVDREIGKFIEVWEYFEGPTEGLRVGGAGKAWEVVTGLAVRFVSSMKL